MDYESIARELESIADRLAAARLDGSFEQVFSNGKVEGLRIAAQAVRLIGTRGAEYQSVAPGLTKEQAKALIDVEEGYMDPACEAAGDAYQALRRIASAPATEHQSVTVHPPEVRPTPPIDDEYHLTTEQGRAVDRALVRSVEPAPELADAECKSHADDDDDGWPDLEHLERELIAARPVSTAALLVVIDRAKSKATECRSVTQSDAERAFAMLAEHERDTVRNLALSMQEAGHIEEADVIFRAMGESDD